MKPLMQFITIAALACGTLAQTLQAALITGGMGFSGEVAYDTSSAGTATAVTSWVIPQVAFTSGTFTTITNRTAVTFAPGNWNFNTTTPTTNFWSVGGFKFELLSSQIVGQNSTFGYVDVNGTGIISGNGYTPTAFTWSFTSQDPSSGTIPPVWSFAASCNSANSNGAPVILIKEITNAAVLSWSDPTFTLQAAPAVMGAFTNVPGANSPYTNFFTGSQRFFRLNQ